MLEVVKSLLKYIGADWVSRGTECYEIKNSYLSCKRRAYNEVYWTQSFSVYLNKYVIEKGGCMRIKATIFRGLLVFFSGLLCLASSPAISLTSVGYTPGTYMEWDYVPKSSEGESVDLKSGVLKLRTLDLHIPGKNGLDINIYRSNEFGELNITTFGVGKNWLIDIPRVIALSDSEVSGETRFACWTADFVSIKFENGETLREVGFGDNGYLKTNTKTAFKGNYIATCSVDKKITSPDGLEYIFGYERTYHLDGDDITIAYVTKIQDRFGNNIKYYYKDLQDSSSGVVQYIPRLERIRTSEGKFVNFQYESDESVLINSISYSGRSVSYRRDQGSRLVSVTDTQFLVTSYEYTSTTPMLVSKVTTSDGAHIEYSYGELSNSGAASCTAINPCPNVCEYFFISGVRYTSECYNVHVAKRRLSGSDIKTQEIDFIRNWSNSSKVDVSVVQNNYLGSSARTISYEFNRIARNKGNYDSGLMAINGLKKSEKVSVGAQLLSESIYDWGYSVGGTVACDKPFSYSYVYKDCGRAELKKSTIKLHRNGGVDEYYKEYLEYDGYGSWIQRRSYNNLSGEILYEKQTRLNDRENWLVGLPVDYLVSRNGISWGSVRKYSYHSATGSFKSLRNTEHEYGTYLKKNESYYSDGQLRKLVYNSSSHYLLFENYKNGLPQKTKVPRRYSAGEEVKYSYVNDYGEVVREIDFNGSETNFRRPLGFVEYIEYGSPWQGKEIEYDFSARTKSVISAQLQETTYWDAVGRVKTLVTKNLNDSDGDIYRTFEYDAYGNLVFESYPSSSISSSLGIRYRYSGLGERVLETHDVGGIRREWVFLSGNRIEYTDGRGASTVTKYLARGVPEYRLPTEIIFPSNAAQRIEILYNKFGNVKEIYQGSFNEKRSYDPYQLLCKISRPDTGITSFGYGGQRKVRWKAMGTTGSKSGCGGESVSDRIWYNYDNQNLLKSVRLNDGTVLQHIGRDPIGNITSLGSQSADWLYEYNRFGLVELEELSIDGEIYSIDWEYDSLAHISAVTYPGGEKVNFLPDPLGRPTKAGAYVDNVGYHPTGIVKDFNYGNGIQRSVAVDASGRMQSISDQVGGSLYLGLSYEYDEENNIASIANSLYESFSIGGIEYDDLGQLIAADTMWGSMYIDYDNKFNVIEMGITGESDYYNYSNVYSYNSDNLLTSVYGKNVNRNFQYDSSGNVVGNGQSRFQFDKFNRMVSSGRISYKYDGNNKVVRKSGGDDDYLSIYSISGRLMSRINEFNSINYVYLGDTLVAKNTIASGNHDPVAVSDEWTLDRCDDFTFNPTWNDKDVDGDTLSVISVDHPNVQILNGQALYFGGTCARGFISFSYVISDESGNTSSATVTLEVDD